MATTRRAVDISGDRAKVGQKQVRKVTNMLMDGLGVVSMLMGCGTRQTGRQELTGSGWWTSANDWTPWESEETVGGFETNSTERCWSKTPGRG